MHKILCDKKAILIFVLPGLILFLGIVVVPILYSGYFSTLKWNGVGEGTFIGLENYKTLFINNTDGFAKSIANSVLLAAMSVFIQLPIALIIALMLASGIKGEGMFRTVFFVPVIVSTVVIAQIWMRIYNPQFGLLNVLLRNIGLESWAKVWIGDTKTALISAIIPMILQYIPYHMLIMYAAIKSVPPEIIEAAKIDGASSIKTSIRIIIPLIIPLIEVSVVLAVIGSLRTFDFIYVLTRGGPLHATEVPSTMMFNTIFHKNMFGYGSAMAIFIIIECLIMTVIIQKIFKKIA